MMVATNFELSLKYVLIEEGGNDDDPNDRGGRTSRGITQREYNAWCSIHHSPTGDVWRASDDTIKAIYFAQYWQPVCDKLPLGVDYVYFDIAVNNGPHEAALLLQRAMSHKLEEFGSSVDGHVGLITISTAVNWDDRTGLIDAICNQRHDLYKAIEQAHPTDRRYDHDWMRRTENVRQRAKAMLRANVVT